MNIRGDDDDIFEFHISSNEFTNEEREAIMSNPLDDPELHKKCKDISLCDKEECDVYLNGVNILKEENKKGYNDISEMLN